MAIRGATKRTNVLKIFIFFNFRSELFPFGTSCTTHEFLLSGQEFYENWRVSPELLVLPKKESFEQILKNWATAFEERP